MKDRDFTINTLEELQTLLVPFFLKVDFEGRGQEDAEEFAKSIGFAIHAIKENAKLWEALGEIQSRIKDYFPGDSLMQTKNGWIKRIYDIAELAISKTETVAEEES